MEAEEEPIPRNEDPAFISVGVDLVVTTVQTYGWLLLAVVLAVIYLVSKLKPQLESWRRKQEDATFKKTDVNTAASRMEAMQRARQKMQEQLDAQAEEHVQKQAEREAQRRQERLEDWDRHLEGRGYRSKVKPSESKPDTNKPPPKPKARLRSDYNPLMGDNSGSGFRPTRRPAAGGG